MRGPYDWEDDQFKDINVRIITCPECGGDGGGESMPTGYNHVTGVETTHWIRCTFCAGEGEVEIEVYLVECDDDVH